MCKVVASQMHQVRLDLVVAERPEQPHGHRHGAGRGARMPGGVELHEPAHAAAVARREARRHAAGLGAHDGPRPRRRRRRDIRTPDDLVDADRPGVDAVGEPARIGHLVDGVHVEGPDVGLDVARPGEQVQQQVGRQLDVPVLCAGRILRLRLARQRVVGEESRLRRALRARQDAAGQQQDRKGQPTGRRRRHQNAALDENTVFHPSLPLASSIRITVRLGPCRRRPMPALCSRPEKFEIGAARRHLAGVVEQRHVHAEAIGNPAKLAGGQQAVPIAEAPAVERAQGAAAAKRRHQEVRHEVVVVNRRLHARAQRHDPGFPKQRDVLDALDVDAG